MKRRTIAQIGGLCACTLAILSGSAFAFYSTNGGGSAQANVTSLTAPTITKAEAATGGTVKLEWSQVSPPSGAGGTVTYYVVRGSGQPAGNCPKVSSPAVVKECTDTGLAPGAYEYKVVAVWNTWTKFSAIETATVTVGPVAKFTITSNNASPATGSAVNLTITARDSAGGTVTTYTGSHSLTFSGASASAGGNAPTVENSSGTAVPFGTATALNFSAGVATVTEGKNGEMTLYKPGETSITATEGSLTTSPALVENVVTTAKYFQFGTSSGAPSAGSPVNLTIKAVDAYGNVITTYTGSHSLTFSGASSSPGGNAPTVKNSSGTAVPFGTATALNFSAGVATVSESKNGEMTLYKAGETSVTASDGTLTTLSALAENVAPATAKTFQISSSSATPSPGVPVNLTIKAVDLYANTVTSYTGSHSLTFSGASASPSGNAPTVKNASGTAVAFGTATALNFTAGVATVSESKNGEMTLYKAGETSVTATDGTLTTSPALAENVQLTASRFVLSATTTTPTAGTLDGLTIKAYDAYENLATNYTGTKNLTFSGPAMSPSGAAATVENASGSQIAIGATTTITFKAGVAAASEAGAGAELTVYKSGATTLTAQEGSTVTTPTALNLTVNAGTATSLTTTASATTNVATSTPINLTETAKDAWGNVATGYAGEKTLKYTATGTASEASPNGTAPYVINNAGGQVLFGASATITFVGGEATVGSSKNGVLRLTKPGSASLTVSDGTLTAPALAFTTVIGAGKVAFTSLTVTAGTISNPCYFTCTVTGLGNSGTITSKITIADEFANVLQNIGSGKTVAIAGTGFTITGSPVSLPATGAATTTATFSAKSPSSGNFTNTAITATSSGYTTGTITASK